MRVHLFDSDEPLKSGEDYVARCLSLVKSAQFLFTLDTSFGEAEVRSALQACRICTESGVKKRYLYGIVGGQEYVQAALDSTD